jgi:hypothetical protein
MYTYMLKNLNGEHLETFKTAQEKAASEGRTMRFVLLELLRGWVRGTYHLGARLK